MNRIIAGGLGVLGEYYDDAPFFSSAYGDFLFENPPILLWADEILVPEIAYDNPRYLNLFPPEFSGPAMDFMWDLISEFWGLLQENKVVKRIKRNPLSNILYEDMRTKTYDYIRSLPPEGASCSNEEFKKELDDKACGLIVGENYYCPNYLDSTMAGLCMSIQADANLILSEHETKVMNWLLQLGIEGKMKSSAYLSVINAFNELYVPSFAIFPGLWNCHIKECKDQLQCIGERRRDWGPNTRKRMGKIIEIRNTDEVASLREMLSKCSNKIKNNDIDINEAQNLLIKENIKARKVIEKNFPIVEKWANLTFLYSLPITVASLLSGNTEIAIVSGSLAAGAEFIKRCQDVLATKYSWLGFLVLCHI